MLTRPERIIIALAFALALMNLLFMGMGMGLLYYICLVVLVVWGSSVLRWAMRREPVTG